MLLHTGASLPAAPPSRGNPQLRNRSRFLVLGAWPCWEPGDGPWRPYTASSHPVFAGDRHHERGCVPILHGETFCHRHLQRCCPRGPSARSGARAAPGQLTRSTANTRGEPRQQTFRSPWQRLSQVPALVSGNLPRTGARCHPLPQPPGHQPAERRAGNQRHPTQLTEPFAGG